MVTFTAFIVLTVLPAKCHTCSDVMPVESNLALHEVTGFGAFSARYDGRADHQLINSYGI